MSVVEESEMVNQYYFLVLQAVERRLAKAPSADRDALESSASVGLLDAIRHFEWRCPSFEPYATQRINGQILDDLRKWDFFPRSARREAKAKGIEIEPILPLDVLTADDSDIAEALMDGAQEHPVVVLERVERSELVSRIVSTLPARTGEIIRAYFWGDQPARVIGERLGITESGICKIIKSALRQCRTTFARTVLFLLISACQRFSVSAFADGPDLYQHVWRSNGMIYVSAHIPACHIARLERVLVLTETNWHESALSAMTVEEDVSTRIVVFSESLSLFPQAFYRVHILRVLTCADIMLTVSACAKFYD